MLSIAVMISNYFHDLGVALLISNLLTAIWVGRWLDAHPGHEGVLPVLLRKMSRVGFWILLYVLLGGGMRAWFFMDYEWNPAVEKHQVAALVVKHILLVTLTGIGVIAYRMILRNHPQPEGQA